MTSRIRIGGKKEEKKEEFSKQTKKVTLEWAALDGDDVDNISRDGN